MELHTLLSWAGCATALIGSALLALNTRHSAWGFPVYLISNLCWIVYAVAADNDALLLQQVGFTLTSIAGCWRWLRPRPGASSAVATA